jgi:hypothetical protein
MYVPPVTESTPVTDYWNSLKPCIQTLSDYSVSGIRAAKVGDVDGARTAKNKMDEAYKAIAAITPPEGYEDVHSLYERGALEFSTAGSYLVETALAADANSSSNFSKYGNKAADHIESGGALFDQANALVASR